MTKHLIANDVLLPEVGRLIAAGRSVTLTVRGHSMNPFLCDRRDRVVLTAPTAESLQPGSVVLAREADTDRFLLHRIVARRGELLTLQGDGNVGQTERVRVDGVLGVMTAAIRNGRAYPVHGRTWCLYSRLWRWLTPVRRLLLAVYRRL